MEAYRCTSQITMVFPEPVPWNGVIHPEGPCYLSITSPLFCFSTQNHITMTFTQHDEVHFHGLILVKKLLDKLCYVNLIKKKSSLTARTLTKKKIHDERI